MKTFIYMSASTWEGFEENALSLPEQSECCRAYMREHREFKKGATYCDRNQLRDRNRELGLMLEELEHRKVECIVVASIHHFFQDKKEASFYIQKVMIPAGLHLVAIRENLDTRETTWEKDFKKASRRKERNGTTQ